MLLTLVKLSVMSPDLKLADINGETIFDDIQKNPIPDALYKRLDAKLLESLGVIKAVSAKEKY